MDSLLRPSSRNHFLCRLDFTQYYSGRATQYYSGRATQFYQTYVRVYKMVFRECQTLHNNTLQRLEFPLLYLTQDRIYAIMFWEGQILRNNLKELLDIVRLDFTQQYSGKATGYAIKIGMQVIVYAIIFCEDKSLHNNILLKLDFTQ